MKFKLAICMLALTATVVSSTSCRRIVSAFEDYECNSTGPMISRTTTLPAISELHSASGLRITYIQCDTLSVTVNAPDDVMPLIETTVEGTTLTCRATKNLNRCAEKVSITVKAPMLTGLSASSGSLLKVATPYNASDKSISVSASSGASLIIDHFNAAGLTAESSSGASLNVSGITCNEVYAKSSSGSSTHLSGKCNDVNFKASSGASLSCGSLKASTGSASAYSGGSVNCYIENPTEVGSSSGGSIHNIR